MGRVRIRGEHGAEHVVDVPGPGIDQRTFDRYVADGLWTVVAESPPTGSATPTEPPRRGAGSGRAAWVAYAVATTGESEATFDGLSRDDVVARLEADGHIARDDEG